VILHQNKTSHIFPVFADAALVRVEDLWFPIHHHRFVYRLPAEICGQRVGKTPGKHPAGEPIQHNDQIGEASTHRYVGDISGPDLIGTYDGQIPQQVWIDVVLIGSLLSMALRQKLSCSIFLRPKNRDYFGCELYSISHLSKRR